MYILILHFVPNAIRDNTERTESNINKADSVVFQYVK